MLRTWDSGQRVIKYIGFDATEDHRANGTGGTYAVSAKLKLCPKPGLPDYKDRYKVEYPLREWGVNRAGCRDILVKAGLPIPPKSCCFFCPAKQRHEIQRMAIVDPAYYCLAIAMEVLYRTGRHYQGDGVWLISAKHKDTGEKVKYTCRAESKAAARLQFRNSVKDERPYRYEVGCRPAVGGLDFGKPWMLIAAELPDAYRRKLVKFMDIYKHPYKIDNRPVLPILEVV